MYSFKWFIFMKMLTDEIISTCVCVCEYMCTHVYICIHILLKLSSKWDGGFCINLCCWMRYICFMPPSHPLPALPHLFSGAPLPQLSHPALPHTGWPFWIGDREGCSLTQLPSRSWLNVYCFLLVSFLLWPVSCPERGDKDLEFTECLFLKSLYAFPTFFLIKKKHRLLVVDK